MQKIKISKKNYQQFIKNIETINGLVTLDKIKMTYEEYGMKCNEILHSSNKTNSLGFKQFIADINDSDSYIEIEHQEYEKMILSQYMIKTILLLDNKSINNMDWTQYGICLESIVKSYYK